MLQKVLIVAALTASTFHLSHSSSVNNYLEGIERLSLHADRNESVWFATGLNSSGIGIRLPVTVPGGIYSDLEDTGRFASKLYYEYNDKDTMWVGRSDWNYTRNFSVPYEIMLKDEIVLVCEGLDTISEIFINDHFVGRSENMFIRYVFDLKRVLMFGHNNIRIEFKSPVEYAHEKYEEHIIQKGYPVPPESLYPKGENQTHMIRKMQSSFSWDWGPAYPNLGIWKDIYIDGYSGAVIRDVMIFLNCSKDIPDNTQETEWDVTARVYYDAANDEEGAKAVFWREENGGPLKEIENLKLKKGKGNSFDICLIEMGDQVNIWMPNGYGRQPLYRYSVSLASNNGGENSTKCLKIGFRTVEVIDDLVDPEDEEKGREFYFKVNGQKIYAKGSNSIPIHVLPERVTEDMVDWLFMSAKETHHNMIRVWGGGIYETETFYDKADEYGILIWQDFQFAVSMYPATEDFLESVREEVATQVKRLQHRTSLALWSGNNEVEGLLNLWHRNNSFYFNLREDYVRLFINNVKVVTEELDPSRVFLPSSPTNWKKSEEEGWIADNALDTRYADVHFYNYVDDPWNWETFWKPRFVSEYGYQSWAHYNTMKDIADDITTWTWESVQMEHRQRRNNGQNVIRDFIKMHLPFPEDYNSQEAFPHMLYLSQVEQAMAVKTQTEAYRRQVDKLDEYGQGHNMGAIYWQLNDIWQGCSWASVEIGGRWKLQMYYTKKFFAPILLSPYRDSNGDLIVELISDKTGTVSDTAIVQVFKLGKERSSMEPVSEFRTPVEAEFLRSKEVVRIKNDALAELGCSDEANSGSAEPCFVRSSLESNPHTDDTEDNFMWLQYPTNKEALRNPYHLITNVFNLGGNLILFKLKTDAISPFVYMTVRGDHYGYFCDNGFIQVEKQIDCYYFSWRGNLTTEEFLERTTVMSLYETTQI